MYEKKRPVRRVSAITSAMRNARQRSMARLSIAPAFVSLRGGLRNALCRSLGAGVIVRIVSF
jgi:hypothetical protein